jgi:hypothetical protein
MNNLLDIHGLEERQQVLWVLTEAKEASNCDWLASAQISDRLASQCGIAMSRQKVTSLLDVEKSAGTVAKTRRGGQTYFKVMKLGEDAVRPTSTQSMLIDPATALTSIRAVEDIFSSLRGNIRVCDAYIDSKTLDYFVGMKSAIKFHVLTENIQDSSRLRRDIAAFEKEHGVPIELRVSAPGKLHDRYVLHADGMLLVGASLKDIAKKQSMIVALSNSMARDVEKGFGRFWNDATKFC